MTAWDRLLAKSSLAVGTAWEHLASLLAGGSGIVVSDGIAVEVTEMAVDATVEDTPVEASVDLSPVEAQVEDNSIIAEVEEW